MKYYRIVLFPLILIMTISIVTGCANSTSLGGLSNTKPAEKADDSELAISVQGTSYPLKVKDFLKLETVIEKKPERVAVLSDCFKFKKILHF